MTILVILVVIFGSITPIITHIEKKLFKQDVMFTNFLCPTATMDLGLHGKGTRCASSCAKTDMCKSFFYNEQKKFCKGSPEVLSTTTGCEFQSGTFYFHPKGITNSTFTIAPSRPTAVTVPQSQYGKPCTGVTNCTLNAGMCQQSTCVCQVGLSYKPSADSCVSSCETYGSTYSEYINQDLDVPYIAEYYYVSLEQCQSYCSESILVCRGVNYSPDYFGGVCRLKSEMNISSFRFFINVHFYTRNCA